MQDDENSRSSMRSIKSLNSPASIETPPIITPGISLTLNANAKKKRLEVKDIFNNEDDSEDINGPKRRKLVPLGESHSNFMRRPNALLNAKSLHIFQIMMTMSIQKHRNPIQYQIVVEHSLLVHRQRIIIHRPSEKMDETMMRIAIERRRMYVAKRRNGVTLKVLSIKFQPVNRIYSTLNWTGMKLIIH